MSPVRILIVDDHAVFAEGLRLLLQRERDLEVVGIAATAAEASRLAGEAKPQVVLMDHYLPDASGVEATAALRRLEPSVAVVMLTAGATADDVGDAVEAGICGYLLKTAEPADVVRMVRRAADGEILLDASALANVLRRSRERARARTDGSGPASLTLREAEVLRLMARGFDTRAIALSLVLSQNTVRGYAQSVIEKFGAHSRLEAVVRAGQLRLLPDREGPPGHTRS